MSERDLAAEIDELAKRIEAIERAATCKGCGKPLLPENAWMEDGCPCNSPKGCNAPAQDDVGEASAESEWPRYVGPPECSVSGAWANGCILIRFDSASSKGVEIFPSKADKAWYGDWTAMENRRIGMGWKDIPRAEAEARIAAARGEKPRLDDAFPIPATVEQGPTPGMKKAANILGYHDDHHQYPQISLVLEVLQKHVGPELAAKAAEIERLKSDIENAVWNLAGCDSIALARKPMDFCRDMARPGLESVNEMASELVEVKQQLATRTQELDEARNERTALRVELGDLKTKYCEQAKEIATARRELGEAKADRQEAAEKLRAAIMAVSEYTSSPPHRRDDHSCLLCRMLESPDYKTYRDAPASKEMLNSALKAMGEKSHEVGQLKQQVSTLTAKLAEAEKQRDGIKHTLQIVVSYLQRLQPAGSPPPGDETVLAQWVVESVAKQLSASTAANVERDRAAEAMEWLEQHDHGLQCFYRPHGDPYTGFVKRWRVETVQRQDAFPTPTDAILAAKAASGTNTGEK